MSMHIRNLLLGAVLLAACGGAIAATPAAGVTGTVGDVPFPGKSRSYLTHGDFVNVDNLRQMRAGLSKDQVRLLLGNPHFKEGLFGVREWNYIFNFHTGNGDEFITCQYQVRYGKEDSGRLASESMHWDGPACMELANRADEAPPATVAAAPSEEQLRRFNLSADALFRFGRYGEDDILPRGREEIQAVASQISKAEDAKVKVIGHTDPIGSESANQLLSERRAETVKNVLVENGVRGQIEAEGRGEKEQVKQCSDTSRESLIACLVPNRRVELIVEGLR